MQIPLDQIRFARDDTGALLNPRGEIHDTTGLQDSVQIAGQEEPIEVFEDGDGYVVIDGHRRVVMARALGWKTIQAEIKEKPASSSDLLARMLTSYVREDLKPTARGRAMRRLATEKGWGIERVAKLCGLKVDVAQLYVDLTAAPEAVQRRVDMGDMSLSAFKALRDKPREVQERAASLDRPTVAACKRVAKADASKGILTDLLDQMQVEHNLAADLGALRTRVMSEWHSLSAGERARIQGLIESLHDFVQGDTDGITDSSESTARLRTA